MSAPSSRRGCRQIPSGGPKPGCLDDEHDVTPQRLPKDSWVGSHSTKKIFMSRYTSQKVSLGPQDATLKKSDYFNNNI